VDGLDGTTLDRLTRRDLLERLGVAGATLALGGTLARPAFGHPLRRTRASTLRVAVGYSPPSLDIAQYYAGGANFIGGLVNEPLVTLDANGGLIPWLASHVDSVSPTKYVFTIRKGVKFADGSPFTPEDVVWSMTRNFSKTSQLYSYFANVKSVKQTGPDHVTVLLKKPDVTFLDLAPIYTLMLSRRFAEPLGKSYAKPGGKMLGTGPFTLTSYGASKVTFDRSPNHWGKQPPVDHVEFDYIKDVQTTSLAMRAGSIDAYFGLGASDVPSFTRIPGVSVLGSLGTSWFLSFDTTADPWNDVHVRRAVAHCWDGAGFVKGPLRGNGEPSNGMVFPWQWRTVMSQGQIDSFFKSLKVPRFDVAAAKAELAKSSHPSGFSASIYCPGVYATATLALQSLASNLAQIGVKLDVKDITVDGWVNKLYSNKNLGLFIIGFAPDYADANDILSISFDSANIRPNAWNTAHYTNPKVDKLLRLEQGTTSRSARAQAMQEIYRIALDDLPYLGLWYENSNVATRKPFRSTAYSPMYYLTEWIYNLTQ
jgi:peptide/nickel transport system substrate-binding protein